MASDSTPNRIFVCITCEWEYSEAQGVPEEGYPAGTTFDELPESFECPECCSIKYWFREKSD